MRICLPLQYSMFPKKRPKRLWRPYLQFKQFMLTACYFCRAARGLRGCRGFLGMADRCQQQESRTYWEAGCSKPRGQQLVRSCWHDPWQSCIRLADLFFPMIFLLTLFPHALPPSPSPTFPLIWAAHIDPSASVELCWGQRQHYKREPFVRRDIAYIHCLPLQSPSRDLKCSR